MFIKNKEELDKIDNFYEREGKVCIGYYRMYFRGGWFGRMFPNENINQTKLTESEVMVMNDILKYISEKMPKGMSWDIQDYLKENETAEPNGRYYFFWENTNLNFLIELTSEYGNEDYPVRIYVYREK